MNFREWTDVAKEDVRKAWSRVVREPDEDIPTVLMFEARDGHKGLFPLEGPMGPKSMKQLRRGLQALGARHAATVHPVWMREGAPTAARREAVYLAVMDGERVEAWFAYVERDEENPPVLGPWLGDDKDERGARTSGEVSSQIQAALR